MSIFQKYAPLYDAFYENKNYQVECAYIQNIIQEFRQKSDISLLDIGCGTGKHARIFAKNDWRIYGIDTASEMIAEAKKYESPNLKFQCVSLQKSNFKNQFEVITSLFAVVSYITDNQKLDLFFKAVSKHLKNNGIFIFDVWFANGVLHLKPENRIKTVHLKDKLIIRKASFSHFETKNLIDVCYNFKIDGIDTFQEKHLMRYFEIKELEMLLQDAGLSFMRAEGFMKPNQMPTKDDWSMTIIAKKL